MLGEEAPLAAMVKRRRVMLSDSESDDEQQRQAAPNETPPLSTAASVTDAAFSLQQPGTSPAALLGILVRLDAFPMTLVVLRESNVAKAVKSLRGHGDAGVASASRALFARWKGAATTSAAADSATPAHSPAAADIGTADTDTALATNPVAATELMCRPTLSPAAALRALLTKRAAAAPGRVAAQRRVYDAMVAKFRGRADFSDLTKTHVSNAFALIDRELLGGQLAPLLKQEQRRICFRVAPRMTSRAGQLLTQHDKPREHELAISSTLLMQTFSGAGDSEREVVVNGCRCTNRTEALLRVVEHEMIHLLFLCEGMPSHCRTQPHHGPAFCSAAKKLFGHKDYRHDLVTPREVAAAGGLEAGCTVRFTMYGETLTGKVNRVTKRATVLVKCAAGHRDARQFSDGEHYRKFFVPVDDCRVLPD